MTPDEQRMLEFLGKGKLRAIKNFGLRLLFRGVGKIYSDPKIRNIIRSLIYDHGIAIVGDPGCGFYIADNDEEARDYESNLYSRGRKIFKRRQNFHGNYWKTRQTELF